MTWYKMHVNNIKSWSTRSLSELPIVSININDIIINNIIINIQNIITNT